MNRRIQVFDYKIFNSLLDQAELCSYLHYGVFYDDVKENFSLQNHSFVKFNPKVITLTTKYGLGKNFNLPTTYIFNRDDSVAHLKTGAEEYAIFKRAARAFLPDYSNDPIAIKKLGKLDGKFLNKQAGLLKFNPKYNSKKIFAFEYDLNAAYLSCMAERWLDTRFAMYDHILDENEAGFFYMENLFLVTEPGIKVDIAFKIIETPESIKNYCKKWFKKKQSDNKSTRLSAKHQIVDSIGFLQYHNPYLRAYIVETCNNFIQSIIDSYPDDWILANTDAIFLTKPINLNTGTEIGQFKIKKGFIETRGVNYKSSDFGDVMRGKQKANYYDIINNRLVRIDNEEK